MLRVSVAAVHFLSLAIGVSANLVRYHALRDPTDAERLRKLFAADNVSGLVAITWIGSGVWRAFGGLEKGTDYYLGNSFFHAKLGLIGLAFAFEIWPMVAFIRWRSADRRGETIDARRAPLFRKLIVGEMIATALAIVCASAMAQGLGARTTGQGYERVQGIFRARCAACHDAQVRTAGLDLKTDARGALVGVRSTQWPELALVVPAEPGRSLLVQKLRGAQAHGASMPPAGRIPDAELAAIEAWVKAGALP